MRREISTMRDNSIMIASGIICDDVNAKFNNKINVPWTFPAVPKNWEESLNSVSNCNILTSENKKWTYFFKGDKIILITCKKNVEFVCNFSGEHLADSTFTYEPKYVYQI